MNLESVYPHLPLPAQNWACSLQGQRLLKRRYGAGFEELYAAVRRRAGLSPSELKMYQQARLRDHLRAAHGSPFWREQFETYRIDVKTNNALAELAKLPIVDKRTVKLNCTRILSRSNNESTVGVHTSGTTGSGLVFKTTFTGEREQWATWWRYREWHGITRDMWCGHFGGRSLVPLTQNKPPLWRVNVPGRQIMFSAYHLRPETAAAYVGAINQYALRWLHGYPSMLSLLAQHVTEQRLVIKQPLDVVTTGAENLLPHQRRTIETAFGCPVREHYGMAEAVANISQWPDGMLRVDEDFAWVEFAPIAGSDDSYRVIGTNWSNPAFPLLRYDTGDVVKLPAECRAGDSDWRLVQNVDGRNEDYVTLPSGVRLGRLDHIFKDLTAIREAQIYQPELGTVVLRVVKGDSYSKHSENELLAEARKRLGPALKVEIEYLAEIPKSRTGKLKFVVSDVKL